MTDTPSDAAKKPTIAETIVEVEQAIMPKLAQLADIGREAARAADADVRRGLIAMNGAGLLAVVSLLSKSFDPFVVRWAVGLYFVGVVAALLAWNGNAAVNKTVAFGDMTIQTMFANLRAQASSQVPIETPEQVDMIHAEMMKIVAAIDEMKKPGRRVLPFSVAAIGCFLIATALLVADFELSPIKPTVTKEAAGPTSAVPAHQPRPATPERQPSLAAAKK